VTDSRIQEQIRDTMITMFELSPNEVHPGARLVDDLGLDSIDAVDLSVRIQEITGETIEEDQLKSIDTVGDIFTVVQQLVSNASS
jgi:acyl carrier protein